MHKGILPSDFMREARPEQYSDSHEKSAFKLDASALELRLDTLTARNQTHDFEIFCRKLCERVICPNLKPATGPEGGGDSKADTETIAVSDDIATLWYVGEANAARERWAFAFSAKKTWGKKARADVVGLAATSRPYSKVIFVTSQYARAKERAALEDELSGTYGFRVEILDRSWIVEQVIDRDQRDLAVDYLGIGERLPTNRMGSADYARLQRLEALEREIQNPQAYDGMESQRATDALLAAKLSRELERPRFETDGRFERAIRLADQHSPFRQRLEARYQRLWTAFYWFDDIDLLNQEFDTFADLALPSCLSQDLELVANLLQNLINIVIHNHRSASDVKLRERMARLVARLEQLSAEEERPNNALEAKTTLLIIAVNQSFMSHNREALSALWPQFSDILIRAEGLIEYSAERLIQIIEVFGLIAGRNPEYGKLVDKLAEFVSRREGESKSGLILLKRAGQLNFDEDRFEIIRLLGKSTRQLAKKEYTESLVEATYLLAVAYQGAGMLWAARANAMFAISSIVAESEANSEPPASLVPALMLLGWIDVELRLLPELLDTLRLIRSCRKSMPLDEESKVRVDERLEQFDLILASQFINFDLSELQMVAFLPDLLGGLGMTTAQAALLYALGYEKIIAGDPPPEGHSPKDLREFFVTLASQPSGDLAGRPLITGNDGPQRIETRVLGMRVVVRFNGTDTSTLVAEILLTTIDTVFATTLAAHVAAHTERFDISVEEHGGITTPEHEVDDIRMHATLRWPSRISPSSFNMQKQTPDVMTLMACLIFGITCMADDRIALIDRLFQDEALAERISTAVSCGIFHSRAFNGDVPRLATWSEMASTSYQPLDDRPTITHRDLESASEGDAKPNSAETTRGGFPSDHRNLEVRSVIDIPLWEKAGWTGVLFADFGPGAPPVMGLLFENPDAGRQIFTRWRERFGQRDTHGDIHLAILRDLPRHPPSHYATLIIAKIHETSRQRQVVVPARMKILEPNTDLNLSRFLAAYARAGYYGLAPAVIHPSGQPDIITALAILKRQLPIKRIDEIGEGEIEIIARHLLNRS